MSQNTISIGMPIYNGGEVLRDGLECLARQTHREFRVLICDNASTDGSSEVCAEFCKQDSRFQHVRHDENKGMSGNFRYALEAAPASDLFMWRAHDDVTSDEYIERLAALHAADDATRLAIGRVETLKMYGDGSVKHRRWRRMPNALTPSQSVRALHDRMFSLHESSYYGLWHRETIAALFPRVYDAFPHPWAADHLTLLPLCLDGTIRGDRHATFTQRLIRHHKDGEEAGPAPLLAGVDMPELHGQAGALFDEYIAEREWTAVQRTALSALKSTWITKRIGKLKIKPRGRLRRAVSSLNRRRKGFG